MVTAAVNEAIRSAQELASSKLGGIAGGWAAAGCPAWAASGGLGQSDSGQLGWPGCTPARSAA